MRERATLLFRIRRSWFGLRLRVARSAFGRGRFMATRFLIVPPNHNLADPTIANDMMAGQIVLAGRILMTHGRQPFTMDAPSRGFAAALAGFQWLGHFEASERRALRDYARVLVRAFLQRRERDPHDYLENPATLARRVVNWITYSALLTEDADAAFYRRIIEQLARDVALLRRWVKRRECGMARLDAAIALLFHALCLDARRGAIQQAEALLASALSATIAPDGSPRDRNLANAVRFATDLDALLAVYRARQRGAPAFIAQVFNRLLSAVRFGRHPDGGLALFNGAGLATRDHIGQAIAIQRGAQPVPASLPDGGFERLENAFGLIIADTGARTPVYFGHSPGASALAFEFSTRMDRVIVNCGMPVSAEGEIARAWRSGPAHSTLLIEEEGAGRIISRPNLRGVRDDLYQRLDTPIPPERRRDGENETILMAHSAFERAHGYRVERELTLLGIQGGVRGRDRFVALPEAMGERQARIAFHLHPGVKAVPLSGGQAIVLRLPREPAGRDLWVFNALGFEPELEESRCHESEAGNPMTQQISLPLTLTGTTVEIAWRLEPYRPEFE
jgi:uncharacterized heparinase superfamily protein